MRQQLFLLAIISFVNISIFAQQDSTKTDTTEVNKKTGFSFGGVPIISYDSDLGLKYGVLVNLFFYGKGENSPDPNHNIYLEWNQTTKGSQLFLGKYKSRTLIKNVRTNFEARYTTEKALHFYGFNGYNAEYNNLFENEMDPLYKSRLFYRHGRRLLLFRADFEGSIIKNKLRWLAGVSYNKIDIDKVDINNLNKSLSDSKLSDTSLYSDYVSWGVIKESEKNGGYMNDIKIGAVYDSRDNEANPNSGIWAEAILLTVPQFLGNQYTYGKLILTHRQYITLIKKRLTFAYRVSYQPKIFGTMPFYALPLVHSSDNTRDGLGGSRTLRGIYRNRVVGEDYVFANIEFRWKFVKFNVLKQNIYLALFPFIDGGLVTKKYSFDESNIPQSNINEFHNSNETLHIGYGSGLAIAINHNFIITATYALANSSKDGTSGLYITINYLF